MRKIVECVPNFSEGRRPEVIEAITYEIRGISGAVLLGKDMDADHNRTVITLAGEPEAVQEAAFRMIKRAAELIDLTTHSGEHPRMGATDVVPFVPVENVTMEECVRLARELGQRVGAELQLPVYLYEEAAMQPERRNLARVRKGQFEGLRDEIGRNPERVPDYGPNHIHPTAGATAVGARFFLIAYNVNLDSQDAALAKRIAKQIRASGGGFPCVKALGLELKEKNCVQVSMNMTNYTVTSLATVYAAIRREAEAVGTPVLESELIGFLPRDVFMDTAKEFLQLKEFQDNQILENRLAQLTATTPDTGENGPDFVETSVAEFLETLASESPTPGGGSASALAGALAGALTRMVCHLTTGKPKFHDVAAELGAVQERAQRVQKRLEHLIAADSQAYNAVLAAFKLPKAGAADTAQRRTAIQDALSMAATIPLKIMKNALIVMELAETLVQKGNPNAITDAGCAVHLAHAAIAGAALNVRVNLASITNQEFVNHTAAEVIRIQQTAKDHVHRVSGVIESKIAA